MTRKKRFDPQRDEPRGLGLCHCANIPAKHGGGFLLALAITPQQLAYLRTGGHQTFVVPGRWPEINSRRDGLFVCTCPEHKEPNKLRAMMEVEHAGQIVIPVIFHDYIARRLEQNQWVSFEIPKSVLQSREPGWRDLRMLTFILAKNIRQYNRFKSDLKAGNVRNDPVPGEPPEDGELIPESHHAPTQESPDGPRPETGGPSQAAQ